VSESPYRSRSESLAIIERIAGKAAPFTKVQLSRLIRITGLVPGRCASCANPEPEGNRK